MCAVWTAHNILTGRCCTALSHCRVVYRRISGGFVCVSLSFVFINVTRIICSECVVLMCIYVLTHPRTPYLFYQAEWVALNYVPFAERSLEVLGDLYHKTACHKAVITEKVLESIIKVITVAYALITTLSTLQLCMVQPFHKGFVLKLNAGLCVWPLP